MAKKIVVTYAGSKRSIAEKMEVEEYSEEIYKFLYSARYKKAFLLAEKAFKRFPQNRFATYLYAVHLGDSGEWVSEKKQEKNALLAARLLRNLLKRTSGIDPRWIRNWRNEYYWFSGQPKKQWLLGLAESKKSGRGHYSMGVGAVTLSLELFKKGRLTGAKSWARKAQSAWEAYFKYVPKYYNAYVWYAQSLGLQGDLEGMECALKKAAKLSKRPLSYREFVDARKAVLSALKKANSA